MINHTELKYVFDQPRLNSIQAMLMDLISEFYFEIKRIKGNDNRVEYALSQSMKTILLVVVSVCESFDLKRKIINIL